MFIGQNVPIDQLVLNKTELKRAEDSLVKYQLSEEERLAIIAKYGAPTAPIGSKSVMMPRGKKKPA